MNNETSPYETPKSSINENNETEQDIIIASKKLRFVNSIIDYFVFLLINIVIGVLVVIVFGDEGLKYIESIPDAVLGISLYLFYYIFFEAMTSRTIGKLVTGTKVVNKNGLKASFGQILGRSFSRLIPFEAFSFFGKDGRGLHDRLANTLVIKCR